MERYIALMQFEKGGEFRVITNGNQPRMFSNLKSIKEGVQKLITKNNLLPSNISVIIFRSLEPEEYPEL